MKKGQWRSRAMWTALTAAAVLLLLSAVRPDVEFHVDDFGHLAFCRHVSDTALAGGGPLPVRAARLVATTFSPDKHFPHVHTGRPVTNLFRVGLFLLLGENVEAYQTVLLVLLVLLAAQLAELAGWLSGRPAGGAFCALLFISCPPVAGLLAWTSHLNLALGMVLAAAGLRLTAGGMLGRGRAGLVLGFPLLLAAMLTRETELFVIPLVLAGIGISINRSLSASSARRWGMPVFYLAVSALLWTIPAFRARTGGDMPLADLMLSLDLARVTYFAQAGTVLKSLAWFLLLPLALVRPSPRRHGLVIAGGRAGVLLLGVCALVLLLFSGGAVHVALLTGLLALALFTGGPAVATGLTWAAAAGLPILFYGAFSGRYAVEPLFGLSLALSPLLGGAWDGLLHRGRDAARRQVASVRTAGALVLALALLQAVFNAWPDVVFTAAGKPGLLRRTAHWGECLVRAMEARAGTFATFAGRVPAGWRLVDGWQRPMPGEGNVLPRETFHLWHDPDGRYVRLGTFYSPMEPELPIWALAVEGGGSWEWNRWFWRAARVKGPKRMLPRLGGLSGLANAGNGERTAAEPSAAQLWAGDEWYRQRLVAAVPQLSDPRAGLALFVHYRHVAEDLGASERQAMVLFETARLFCQEDGRCDAYERHLLDRIALSW